MNKNIRLALSSCGDAFGQEDLFSYLLRIPPPINILKNEYNGKQTSLFKEIGDFNIRRKQVEFKEKEKMNDKKIPESDPTIPENERIYSPNKTCWCRKTSKESADLLFKMLKI